MQEASAYADFKRIFSKFASAEEVTGAKKDDPDKEANGGQTAAPAAAETVVCLRLLPCITSC